MKARILHAMDACICFVRKTWRPATCIGIAGGAIVNLIVIPLATWTVPDMAAAGAYVAAATAAFSVRAFEKSRGLAD